MRILRAIIVALVAVVAILMTVEIPLAAGVPVFEQESGVYAEYFTSYDYKDYADPTVRWDVFSHTLSLAPMSGRYQNNPEVVPDNRGGVYVVWEEIREDDKNWDVYIQRLDEDGDHMWATDVLVQQENLYGQLKPALCVDSAGNAIVVWHDDRDWPVDGSPPAVYAQKISPDGERLWTTDVKVNSTSYLWGWDMRQLAVDSDTTGDVVVVWQGGRSGTSDMDVYAQRLDSTGQPLWPADVQVNDDDGTATAQRVPDVSVDSQGYATVVWVDERHLGEDIYAQRLDGAGNRLWAADVAVSEGVGVEYQGDVSVALDGQGNGVIVWRYGPWHDVEGEGRVYVQKVSISGQRLWTHDVKVNQHSGGPSRDWPSVAVTTGGDIIVVWHTFTPDARVYLQRLTAGGIHVWDTERVLLPNSMERFYIGRFNLDANDRGYLVWSEWPLSASNDVFLQQVDVSTGTSLWSEYAVRVEQGNGSTSEVYPDVVAHRDGDATVIWGDFRRADWAVYGRRVDATGQPVWPKSYMVNRDPTNQGWLPSVSVHASGDSVAAWMGREGIMAQRFDSAGNRQWVGDLSVKEKGGWYQDPTIVSAPDGTFYVVWLEQRTTDLELWDIRAQLLSAEGGLLWASDVRVNRQDYVVPANWAVRPFKPAAAVDDEGYLVVTWYGNGPAGADIFVQRLSSQGLPVWTDEVAIGASLPAIGEGEGVLWGTNNVVGVSAEAAIALVWMDNREGDLNLYARWLDKSGTEIGDVWRVNDDSGSREQRSPALSETMNGGFVVSWTDFRNGPSEVFAQRFDATGTRVWPTDVRVSQTSEIWAAETNISRQPLGYFYITWRTSAFKGDENVYLQRLSEEGTVSWDTDLSLTAGGRYVYSEGEARSKTLDNISEGIALATLTADVEVQGGEAQFYLTNDGGLHWSPVTPGIAHIFTTTGSDLRWRVRLATSPSWVDNAPVIRELRVEYRTDIPLGDNYEPDDSCAEAQPIQIAGASQQHIFHQFEDSDWVWFEAQAGTTYLIQTSNVGVRADTLLDLYTECGTSPLYSVDNEFGPEATLSFVASSSARYYLRVSQQDGGVYGGDTNYDLTVRVQPETPGAAIIVAGRSYTTDYRQPIINATANLAYQTLREQGFSADDIYYLNSDPYQPGVDDTPTKAHLQEAIEMWARSRVGVGRPLWLYLADHGKVDRFHNEVGELVTAEELDLWLSNLEATSGVDQVNVIIDACHSGSFIDTQQVEEEGTLYGAHEISKDNRVVVASTTYNSSAYAPHGANSVMYFSEGLWRALGRGQNLWHAYLAGRAQVEADGLGYCGDYDFLLDCQRPWLDDTGDAWFDEDDGRVAETRGLIATFGGGIPPYIEWVQAGEVVGNEAAVTARVVDDVRVERVWARFFAPSFKPPTPVNGSIPVVEVPVAELIEEADGIYQVSYTGFSESGIYRVVVYAEDDEGITSVPQWIWIGERRIYLPLVVRQ